MRLTTAGAVLGLIVVVVGSIGPWVSTVLGSAAGTHGDGKITLGAAAVALVALAVGRGSRGGLIVAAFACLVALATAGYDAVHIEYEASKVTLFGSRIAGAGWGVYAALVGAAGSLIALAGNLPRGSRYTTVALVLGGCVGVIVAGGIYESKKPSAAGATSKSNAFNPNQVTSKLNEVPSNPSTTDTSGTPPPTTVASGTATPGGVGLVAVIQCQTKSEVTSQPANVPTQLNVLGGARSTGGLVAYTNSESFLVGPAGMTCSGTVAADGGQQIIVWPAGDTAPSQHSQTGGLTLSLDPACASCRAALACPFLMSFAASLGFPCTAGVPAGETVDRVSARAVLFEDPPGLAGDGSPSGGPDPANGVVGVSGGATGGVFRATCTLPASEHSLCTTSLNDVIARYG